ncbi:hypothetical protein AK830_g2439 [Neonectria ditissima]|uniref:Uncharacterized protein n=1 Tax=Neonectria ditissima TaxID=78410 RepID=A0A0P7BK66_9HYPO|nr:hypothetical protein AK830_g2439 [Neonectria ditissima]
MADPFSIASGAAGLISLGLSVCQGLTTYILAVKSHGEDVRTLEKKINTLQGFLNGVEAMLRDLPHHQGAQLPGDAVRIVRDAMSQSKAGMARLAGYLENCAGDTLSTISSSGAEKSKLRKAGKKAVYFFRKGSLKELEHILDGVQNQLDRSLQLLGLCLLVSRSQEHHTISGFMSSLIAEHLNLQSSVTELDTRLLEVSESINTLSANVATSRESCDLTIKGVQEMSLHEPFNKLMLWFVLIIIPLLKEYFSAIKRAYQDIPLSLLSLSTDNIRFEDMFGRSFSLQFNLVREWRVFEAFLVTQFEASPGETFVSSGRYHLLRGSNNIVLPKSRRGWANAIYPGARVMMSLQADGHMPKRCPRCGNALESRAEDAVIECPTTRCWTAFREDEGVTNKIHDWQELNLTETMTQEVGGQNLNSTKSTGPKTIDLELFTRVHFPTFPFLAESVAMYRLRPEDLEEYFAGRFDTHNVTLADDRFHVQLPRLLSKSPNFAVGALAVGKTDMPLTANGEIQRGLYGRADSLYNRAFHRAAMGSGSSNGCGSSTASSMVVFGMAEEAVSSGRSPASNNGLVAYTPSQGILSICGNRPLSPVADVVVPHARIVKDLLVVSHISWWKTTTPLATSGEKNLSYRYPSPRALGQGQITLQALGAVVEEVDFPLVTNHDVTPVHVEFKSGSLLPANFNGSSGPKTLRIMNDTNSVPMITDNRNGSIVELPGLNSWLQDLKIRRKRDLKNWVDESSLHLVTWCAAGDVGVEDAEVNELSAELTWRNGMAKSHGNFAIRQLGVPTTKNGASFAVELSPHSTSRPALLINVMDSERDLILETVLDLLDFVLSRTKTSRN